MVCFARRDCRAQVVRGGSWRGPEVGWGLSWCRLGRPPPRRRRNSGSGLLASLLAGAAVEGRLELADPTSGPGDR